MWPAGLLSPPQAQSTEATFFAASATAAAISVKPGVSERGAALLLQLQQWQVVTGGMKMGAVKMTSGPDSRFPMTLERPVHHPLWPRPDFTDSPPPSRERAPPRDPRRTGILQETGAFFGGAGARRRRRCGGGGGGAKRENGEVLPRALLRTVRLTPSLLSLLPSPSPAAFLYNVPSFVPVRF